MATIGSGQQQAYGVSTAPSDVLTPEEQAKAAQQQGTSGFFNKVSDFLKANQGSDFAGQIASNVSGKVGSVSGESTKAKEAFQTEAEKGRSKYDEATSKKTIEGAAAYDPTNPAPSYAAGTSEAIKPAPIGITNIPASTKVVTSGAVDTGVVNPPVQPPAAALDDAAKQAATRMLSGNYSGPMDVQGSQGLQAKAEEMSRLASGFTSGTSPNSSAEASRFASLSRLFGSPTYVPGQQKLDALLLTSPQAQQRLAQLRTTGVQGLQGVQSDLASARQAAAQYGQEAGATKKTFLGDITGAMGSIDTEAQDAADAQAIANQAAFAQAQSALAGDQVSKEYQPLLQGVGGRLYNLKLSDYITAAQDPSKQQTIQSEQLHRLRGLGNLAGDNLNMNPDEYKSALDIQSAYKTDAEKAAGMKFRADEFKAKQSTLDKDYEKVLQRQQVAKAAHDAGLAAALDRQQKFDWTGRNNAPGQQGKQIFMTKNAEGLMDFILKGGVTDPGYGAERNRNLEKVFDDQLAWGDILDEAHNADTARTAFEGLYNPNRKISYV